MNALSRRIEREKMDQIHLQMADSFIKLAILTADDIWGTTQEDTERFVKAYQEVVNGYGEVGVAEIDKELQERGIQVEIKR